MPDKSDLLWNTVSLLHDGIYKEVFINLGKFLIFFFGQIILSEKSV